MVRHHGQRRGAGTRAGTFQGNWAEWQQLADAGHSVQSHTTNHKSGADLTEDELTHMYKDSLDAINAHITNNVACCIAYPSGDAHPDVLAKYAIAGRGVYGVPSAANTINYLCTNKGGPDKGLVQIVAFGETTEPPTWVQGKKNLARGLNVVLYPKSGLRPQALSLARAFWKGWGGRRESGRGGCRALRRVILV